MRDYDRIAKIITFLEAHSTEQPDLALLADCAGLSPFHFHRLFVRWAGITPKAFLKCLTIDHAKRMLSSGCNVLDTALETGLSGPGRLHDLCISMEAASPGEIKSGGAGWTIQAGFAESPFGTCLIGEGPRGICHLSFIDHRENSAGATLIARHWPHASIAWNDETARKIAATIFTRTRSTRSTLQVLVAGSAFQIKVWRALLSIPEGNLATYAQIARGIGQSSAARAVGSAVSQNPIAFLIPCHRVIRSNGLFGEYHWGGLRKKALIAWETGEKMEEQ
jgi:AraC family transcriptional regulator of adaptative response/methylated-DNA-[protein]-cysteine methyltransferase